MSGLTIRSGFRSGVLDVGAAGTPVANHEANAVAWVPGRGFIAAHDRLPVSMISQDGNLWGAVATNRVLGQIPMHTVDQEVWAVDALLPLFQILNKTNPSLYPNFQAAELGVLQLTDAINCWASSPTAILLLSGQGCLTYIPRTGTDNGPPAPAGSPSAPQNVAIAADNLAATVSWDAPSSTGTSAIVGYSVQYSPDSGTTWLSAAGSGTSLSRRVTGLVNGTPYTFRVAAINTAGTGEYSAWAFATPAPVAPSAPTNVLATPTSVFAGGPVIQYRLTWTAPSNTGGAPITGYAIQFGSQTTQTLDVVNSTATSYTTRAARWFGATNVFRVAAINASGQGAWSASSPPSTLPQ